MPLTYLIKNSEFWYLIAELHDNYAWEDQKPKYLRVETKSPFFGKNNENFEKNEQKITIKKTICILKISPQGMNRLS